MEGSKEGRGGGPWCLLPSQGPLGVSFLTQQRLSNPYPPPPREQKLWEAGGTSDNECPWLGCPGPSDGKWEDPSFCPSPFGDGQEGLSPKSSISVYLLQAPEC